MLQSHYCFPSPKKAKLSLCLIIEHHTIETYWESGGIAPLFLALALDGGEWSGSCTGKGAFVPTGYEAQWAPELVWMTWKRGKSLGPNRNWIPAVQHVACTITTQLSWLPFCLHCSFTTYSLSSVTTMSLIYLLVLYTVTRGGLSQAESKREGKVNRHEGVVYWSINSYYNYDFNRRKQSLFSGKPEQKIIK
jgi:hypothetical protein